MKTDLLTSIAHGRVNLIGEHTDYNDGFVLPTVIPQHTTVLLRPREDRLVKVTSDRAPKDLKRVQFQLGEETKSGDWTDYVKGATQALSKMATLDRGFEIEIQSNVPNGSGVSSSAALLVSLLRVFREYYSLKNFDDVRLSQLCQKIENEFVGAHVGIMDPMAVSLARPGDALFLDTRSLEFEQVEIPLDLMDIAVISSGITHRHSGGSYNQRRAECEQACRLLGVKSLRELSVEDQPKIDSLPDPLNRRARHVVTENQRVKDAVKALRAKDCKSLGELFNESHVSMSRDYEVSIPEIDLLVDLASQDTSVFGARLTGGGFGGSIVLATKQGEAGRVTSKVAKAYAEKTGEHPEILVPPQS